MAEQRVIEAKAGDLAGRRRRRRNCAPPATIVIGEVVRLRGQGLRWFDVEESVNGLEYEALRPILEES